MFVGTPCQVAALRKITINYNNKILLVDFICHGVNSPKLFSDFINYVETKKKKRIKSYFNRSKDFGWKHTEKLVFDDGESDCQSPLSQAWRNLFYTHKCLRPSCYHCLYNSFDKRKSDITIADYWGIEKYHPEFDSKLGASLIVIYTAQGKKWFENCKNNLVIIPSNIEKCLERQPHFRGESAKCSDRSAFWKEYKNKGIGRIIYKYGKCGIKYQVKYFIKKLLRKNKK